MVTKAHKTSEINASPVPPRLRPKVFSAGIEFYIYYDCVSSPKRKLLNFREFPFFSLSHLIDGDGFYQSPDMQEPVQIEKGTAVLCCPGVQNAYGARTEVYTEDSLCFGGPVPEALMKAGIIRNGLMAIGAKRRLQPIIKKLREATLPANFEACLMLHNLLFDLYRENPYNTPKQTKDNRLDSLLQLIRSDVSSLWTVKEMAEYCNLFTSLVSGSIRTFTKRVPGKRKNESGL
ncbi:MAG: hypothetical protein GY750_11890 [Lentisphaerae bacterium]|nr:hypothetical protein [Lentisphaerota bacterium]MCP4102115.1 hypothetical protein [Lentisphaerota bacterium]